VVTAKVKVTRCEPTGDGQVALEFQADYEDGRNKDWAKYTPGLSINMTVKEEVAEGNFALGDAFTLTFDKEAE
jgi:hypothetical protein